MKAKNWRPKPESLGHPDGPGDKRVSADSLPSESSLVDQVLAGDSCAYGPLVERYQRSVYGLIKRLMGKNGGEAEDLTQETFIRAYQFLDSLEKRNRFGPWVYQIARSLCRDRIRRLETEKKVLQHRWNQLRLQSIPSRDGMGSALSQVPPREQEVLKMRYFDGLSYDEIATRKGLTFSQVDHLMRKARARLAQKIKLERKRERTL